MPRSACLLSRPCWIFLIAGFLSLASLHIAARTTVADQPVGATPAHQLSLVVFVRGDDEGCQRAAEFARDFGKRRPGVTVDVRDVLTDEKALDEFYKISKRLKIDQPGLPAFQAFDRFPQGFTDAATTGPTIESLFDIEVFARDGCPHCRDAKKFLNVLAPRWPGIRLVIHNLADADARQRMGDITRRAGVNPTGVPVIAIAGRVLVGYSTDATSGREIESLLAKGEYTAPPAKQAAIPQRREGLDRFAAMILGAPWAVTGWLEADGSAPAVAPPPPSAVAVAPPPQVAPPPRVSAPPPSIAPPPASSVAEPEPAEPEPKSEAPKTVELPWLGEVNVDAWGLPGFTLVIGLIDGFNPCAMWVLVFLLSVLANVNSRARMLAIAGTFVGVSGLAYFAFMAAWLNVFMLLGMERPLQIGLGVLATFIGLINVKDFFAFKKGISFSIPESAKPGIYQRVRQIVAAKYLPVALGLAIVLAVGVNTIELLCTAGLPALYTQILTAHELPTWKNYAYLALYNAAYMFDDTLLLATFVITLSHRKLQQKEGRWLKLISGAVILAIGLLMLVKPEWLHWRLAGE